MPGVSARVMRRGSSHLKMEGQRRQVAAAHHVSQAGPPHIRSNAVVSLGGVPRLRGLRAVSPWRLVHPPRGGLHEEHLGAAALLLVAVAVAVGGALGHIGGPPVHAAVAVAEVDSAAAFPNNRRVIL